jgi:hypothetical protein
MNMTNHMHAPEWLEGVSAAKKGAAEYENPYIDGGEQTYQSRLWSDGLLYGREQIEKRST